MKSLQKTELFGRFHW